MRRFWVYPQPLNADIERKSLVSMTVKTNKQNTKCGYGKRELDSTHKKMGSHQGAKLSCFTCKKAV